MVSQDSAPALRGILARLGKHSGLAGGAERLRSTEIDVGPLVGLPVVHRRAYRDGVTAEEAVLAVVSDLAAQLDLSDRLIADAALSLGLLRGAPPPGIDPDRLYAADLGQRRTYLSEQWEALHRGAGATRIPPSPTVRSLRSTLERRALGALATLLASESAFAPGAHDTVSPTDASARPRGDIGAATVLGDAVIDHFYRVDRLPGKSSPSRGLFGDHIGGKGLNRAVAAARLGLDVRLLAAVGDDLPGKSIGRYLTREHVDIELVKIVPAESTPVACVIVDDSGNSLTIGSANDTVRLTREDLNKPGAREAITESDALLVTFEPPVGVLEHMLRMIQGATDPPWLLVHPTPPMAHPQYLYKYFPLVDYMIGSRAQLAGLFAEPGTVELPSVGEITRRLRAMGVDNVCVVDGFECHVVAEDDSTLHLPRSVAAQLDSSPGAHAAFMAALAYRLVVNGRAADRADFEWATAAMAATQSFGEVADTMPTAAEIDRIARYTATGPQNS
ncbi:hypothetical protein IU433_02675 [Nocardia puris]|uniref:PfkB family carbohydrate kinase n=1 Tax=Nocardia puris TaxID=208602 RepID=UPI0018952C55|nr:PfkB family carbohydrate kinase [Nocardia puris]MBF6210143.1 hypothetical protein [Nocardia puris]MBF6368334.1 hypothetical protein [Nocardia puris]MBF6457948.1 hypothetical protein [Nocardia puris]